MTTLLLFAGWAFLGWNLASIYHGHAILTARDLAKFPLRVFESACQRLADEDCRAGFGVSPEYIAVRDVALSREVWCRSKVERKAARKATLARIFTRKVKVTP